MPATRVNIPGVGAVNFPDGMADWEIDNAVRKMHDEAQAEARKPQGGFIGTVSRAAAPFVEMGKGLLSAAGGIPQIPGAVSDLLESENRGKGTFEAGVDLATGKTPAKMLGRVLGGGFSMVKEGTDSEVQRHASDPDASPTARKLRALLASTVVGAGPANMIEKASKGDYAGAVSEGVLNFGPGLAGKFARLAPVKKFMRGGVTEEAAAVAAARNSPTGKMMHELGGRHVAPEVTAQRAAKIAEEELQKVGARTQNLRGDVAPPLSEVVTSPETLKSSIKSRLAARDEELRYITDRSTTQNQIQEMRLKDELMGMVPEKFTPTEAGSFVAPELKSRLSELQARFPKGTKGYKENVAPFLRGAPGKAISKAQREVLDQVGKIPLESAQQWGLLAKHVAGDADAVRALRSDFINNRLGAASKSPDAFVAKIRSTPPDTLYAVLGEDAGPMMRVLDRLDELGSRNQNMSPRGGKVIPTQRLEVLEQALDEIGKGRAGQGFYGKFLTAAGFTVQSRILRILPFLTAQGSPNSVLRFWRAFDVFTRNGYAPAFIQTVNAIERRTREEESKSNEQPN